MSNLNLFDPKREVLERLNFANSLFSADVTAMPSELLASTSGGVSRCGYDFLFELTGFYDSFADLLVQGPNDIEGPSGWVRAPQEFYDKDSAVAGLHVAIAKFVSALESYRGDFLADQFPSPVGVFTPIGIANLAVWHTMYHSGQLNYIQTIHGDEGFHWA